jgi:hypothetical protein
MRRLAPLWADLTPLVYAKMKGIEADMYAYAMAAAHLQLRHTRVEHMQLSNPITGGMLTWQKASAMGHEASREGWRYVDDVFFPDDAPNASQHPCDCHTPLYSTSPRAKLPTFLHYCQVYKVPSDDPADAKYLGFAKWSMPSNILHCNTPLLEVPRAPKPPRGAVGMHKKWHRKAFLLCQAMHVVNQALQDHKQAFCPGGFNANRTLRLLHD